MKKIFLAGGALLSIGLAVHVGKLLTDAGVFWKGEAKGFTFCTERARLTGAEDMEWSPGLKRVIVSADFRPAAGEANPPSGAIYAFNPDINEAAARVSPDLPFSFHPHGIALWEDKNGTVLLAINHRPEESTIERFRWEKDGFRHEETLRDPLLITPNDLVATGPREFFLSHDHGSRSHFAQAVEHYARLGRGYLTRFDGKSFARVADGIFFANGLALDSAQRLLYVAAMLEKSVRVYDVKDPAHPAYLRRIQLSAGPDNVKLASDGALWIAAHPKILTLKKHSEHHQEKAPSVIIRVKNPAAAAAQAEEVMVEPGPRLSAASVALPLGENLYLGTIYDNVVLRCPLP
jgi:arylesterase / paraoxonase